MDNKLYDFINYEMDCSKNNNVECFVVIRNPLSKITHWGQFGYDVTYDCIYFDNVSNMVDFINGIATYDCIDNSCKLHDGETVLYSYMNGVNKYVNLKNIITALYDDFYINAINNHGEKNWKYQFLPENIIKSLDVLHDDIVDLIHDFLPVCGFNFYNKFYKWNNANYDKCISRLHGEMFNENNDTLISLMCDTIEMGIVFQHCIKNGVSKNVAKSIKRHFEKINGCYNHGWELFIVNKNYCTNYMDFEKSINYLGNDCYYKNGVCVSEF